MYNIKLTLGRAATGLTECALLLVGLTGRFFAPLSLSTQINAYINDIPLSATYLGIDFNALAIPTLRNSQKYITYHNIFN